MCKRSRDSKSAADKEVSLSLAALGVPVNRVPKVIATVKDATDASTRVTRYAAQAGPSEFFEAMKRSKELALKSGQLWTLEWCDPAMLLERVLEENDSFHAAFVSALSRHPATQCWSIIIGFDECWAGNILAVGGRKSMNMSYTFDQFRKHELAKSASWLTFAVVETRNYKDCPGGWSQVARVILEEMFLSSTNGFQTTGAVLSFRNRHLCLRASLDGLVTDGDGFRLLYEWNGGGGIRNCLCCSNIVSRPGLAAASRTLRHTSCSTISEFQVHVFESLFAVVQALFRDERDWLLGRKTLGELKEHRRDLGFKPTPEGVWGHRLCAQLVDPTEKAIFDWLHNCVQDGVFSAEFISYMSNVPAASVDNLQSFLDSGWRFPHAAGLVRSSFNVLLSTVQCGHLSGHNRPSATQVLTCCGLVRFWICDHVASPYKSCLNAILDFMGLIQYAKYSEDQIKAENAVHAVATEMLTVYKRYVDASSAVHGSDWAIAKTHWNWHVIFQYAARGRIYDTFPVERSHRRVKPFARMVEDTSVFGTSVLTKLVAFQCKEGLLDCDSVLIGKEQPISHFAIGLLGHCSEARNACNICGYCEVHSGDFIRSGDKCGRVVQAVTFGDHGAIRIICQRWASAGSDVHYLDVVSASSDYEAWDPAVHTVGLPLAWRMRDAANAVVLFRPQWLHRAHT